MIFIYSEYKVKKRIIIALLIISFLCFLLLTRLGYVTFFLSNKVNPLAYAQWSRDIPIEGKRGNIYDRNGKLIVGNMLTPSVAVIKRQIKDSEQVALSLSEILDCDIDLIYKHLDKNVSVELIKPEGRRISVEAAQKIINLGYDGVYVVGDTSRYYPYGNTMAHVLGFTGIDNQGICGLEYIYDSYLKGQSGALSLYTDAKGKLMPDMVSYYNEASKGFDLYLTIDIDIQLIVENVIKEAVKKYNPESMLVICQEPNTGEILAMASYPSFDLLDWRNYDPEIYNRNLPIWKSYEPGSTFKIVTYSAGLERGVFSFNELFHDPGYKIVSGARIKDWKAGGHGTETFLEVIENSCNPGFMEIGERLGVDTFYEYLVKYGFGEKTGIDLLGEAKGIIFKKENMGPVELATSSFGQGNSVTPIQLSSAMCAAINGGYLLKPFVLKTIRNELDEIILENNRVVKRQVITKQTSDKMRYALECVVAHGTGSNARVQGYRVGGKTGTAQKISASGGYLQGNYILSFLGASPMNDPKAVVYLAIDNPKNTVQYGGVVAAPLVGDIMKQILPLLDVKKDYENQIRFKMRNWLEPKYVTVPDFVGVEKKKIISSPYYNYLYIGSGTKVIDQIPQAGETVVEGGTIMLYLN